MHQLDNWEPWERAAAARAVAALEAGVTTVHEAVHSLLECCLQLHPAAAQRFYEAAKKDDDMFSPRGGGGFGSGGFSGGAVGLHGLPPPGRASLALHPAALPGTAARHQEQQLARMEAGSGSGPFQQPPDVLLPAGLQHPQQVVLQIVDLDHTNQQQLPGQQPQRLPQLQLVPQHSQRQVAPAYGPSFHAGPPWLKQTQHDQQQEHSYGQQQGSIHLHSLPQQLGPPQWAAARPGTPQPGLAPQTAAATRPPPPPLLPGNRQACAAVHPVQPPERRTVRSLSASGASGGARTHHGRDQSWDDFQPVPPPDASRRRVSAGVPSPRGLGGTLPPINCGVPASQPLPQQHSSQPAGAAASADAAESDLHPSQLPAASGDAGACGEVIAGYETARAQVQQPLWQPQRQQAVSDPWDAAVHETSLQAALEVPAAASAVVQMQAASSAAPAVMTLPLDIVAAPAAEVPPPLRPLPAQQRRHSFDPRLVQEVDFQQLAFQHQIGEGGFGKVYRGDWRGAAVAVKLVSQAAPLDGALIAEFRRELSTMAALPPHPHVLPLLAACTAPPHLAIITPFCARGSLYGLLHAPGLQLSWRHVVHLALGAARGMAHLHACHILHRDLKSGNLLVEADWTVRVADFGLSRVVADLNSLLTGGLGTYQWMAPEVLGHQRYTEKADVYSFGVVLWECAARALPYAGLNGMQAAMAVMNRGLRPDIPPTTPHPLVGARVSELR